MPAFNARLRPKSFLGLPLEAAITLVIAALCLMFTLIVPVLLLNVFTGMLACVALVVAVRRLLYGEDFRFVATLKTARRESASYSLGLSKGE